MKTSKKGISLIVLVITIIVMIILATAIILSLNSSNIVEKAKEAKTASDLANAKNVVILAKGEWELMSDVERTSNGGSFVTYAEGKLQEAGYDVSSSEGALSVGEDGTIYKYPKIPNDFVASIYEGEKTVDEGLVIYETSSLNGIDQATAMTTYNQYVWVPVDDFTKFERTTTYDGTITDPGGDYTEPFSQTTTGGITLSLTNDLTGEYAEYAKMVQSVETNGGFYIARYEAGKEETDTVVSKKNATVWSGIKWGASMTEIGISVAVYRARSIYPESANKDVVSTLIYGVQWDAVMKFMEDIENPNVEGKKYIENSTGMGWYSDNYSSGNADHKTGIDVDQNKSNMVKNIYDMAGNVVEWTMEARNTGYRVVRGGYYSSRGSGRPASYRNDNYPDVYEYSFNCGFRPALYMK